MTATTHLGLPYLAAAQAQKHVTVNESLRRLDGLVQLSVASRTTTAPPGSPAEGLRYLVPASATGAWAGWDGDLALYTDGAWMRLTVRAGWVAWVVDTASLVVWTGSAWIDLGLSGEALTLAALTITGALTFGSTGSPQAMSLNGAGWHAQGIFIADDAVGTITPPRAGGFLSLTCSGQSGAATPLEAFSARAWVDTGTTLNIIKASDIAGVGASVDVVTTDVAGTTGTDGRVTIAVQSGVIKIENRSGAGRNFQVVLQ